MSEMRRILRKSLLFGIGSVFLLSLTDDVPGAEVTDAAARKAMQQATNYFTSQVSTEGGYLWKYSQDLKDREGENRAPASLGPAPGNTKCGRSFSQSLPENG